MLPSSRSPYLQNLSSAVAAITIVLCASYALAAGPTQQELDDAARSTDSWLTTNKSYDGHRYVQLDQINVGNAPTLREICTYRSGINAPAQATPLLYQGRLYLDRDHHRGARCAELQ